MKYRQKPIKRRKPIKRSAIKRKRKKRAVAYGRMEISKLRVTHLKQDLEDIYAPYIRMRDADDNGAVACFSCGKPGHWTSMQNGHYLSRKEAPGLIYVESNTNRQCFTCNITKEGNKSAYREAMIRRYGEPVVASLEYRKNIKSGLNAFEYRLMIVEYIDKFLTQCIRLNHEPTKQQQRVLDRWLNNRNG